jgi:hypothetical protein
MEKLGEGQRALGIASDWVRTKLAPTAVACGESVTESDVT